MKPLAIAAALALAATTATATAIAAPILGGSNAGATQFPTAVELDYGSATTVSCSGVLVGSDWVMTSAACLTPASVGLADQPAVTSALRVHVGTIDVMSSPGTVATASNTIPNPTFSEATPGQFDLGLVHLSAPIGGVVPALVNLHPEDAPVGTAVTEVGYGLTAPNADNTGAEHFVTAAAEPCAQIGQSFANDDNLLCFSQDPGGFCTRDDGGPAFATIGSGAKVVGVASFFDPTCAVYGAATRTDAEVGFLIANAPILECHSDADCVNSTVCNADGQCDAGADGGGDAGLGGGGGSATSSGGCCEVGGDSGGGAGILALGVIAALVATRRPSSRRSRSRPRAAR